MALWVLFALLPVALGMPLGDASEYFDVQGSGSADWRLVFRGTAGIGIKVWQAYRDGIGIPDVVEDGCKSTDWEAPCNNHYRNDAAMASWEQDNIQEVMLGVVDGGALVKTVTFRGAKTDPFTWFDHSRIIDSCWEDLKSSITNFFSIKGDKEIERRFFMSNDYDTCPRDVGWVVAVDNLGAKCDWEQGVIPVMSYAAGPHKVTWDEAQVKKADALVVFVKYFPTHGLESEYFDLLGTGVNEWRFAFRGTGQIGASVYDAYVDGADTPVHVDEACKQIDWTRSCSTHYRNFAALDNWQNVDQVLFGVISGGAMVKTTIFNAAGADYTSWFNASNVAWSDWADLDLKTTNFFSVKGEARDTLARRFYMSHKHSGQCANDQGWFIAVDTDKPNCQYEKGLAWPILKYASGPLADNVNNESFRVADAFVVFLKYAAAPVVPMP